MLSSISPVGESARGQRWSVTIVAYTLASVLAGLLLGAALGGVGTLVPLGVTTELWLLAGAAAVGLVADVTVGVPSLHRQVDQRWLTTYRGWVYGAGFGAQMGTGVATIIPGSIVWLLWLAALLSGGGAAGAVVGGAFGLIRALPLVAAGRIRTVSALRDVMRRMDQRRRAAIIATRVGQVTIAVVAASRAIL